jgi:phage host-nuclease inhibitor protein Gam
MDFNNPVPYLVGLLIVVLGYFLKDAHTNIKVGLKEKASQDALDRAQQEWRSDLKDMQDRHQRETTRLEHQYEQKFAGVVQQFQDRMNSVEKNLQDRMDLILELLKKK